MHSSWMCTARLLTVSRSIHRGVSASGPGGACLPHLPPLVQGGQCMLGYTPYPVHAGIHTHPCIVHAGIHPHPVDRQTPVKTLPSQTSFADGN